MNRLLRLATAAADAAEACTPPALSAAAIARLRRMGSIVCETYDGDRPTEERAQVRRTVQLVFSNIDMLHAGILARGTRTPGRGRGCWGAALHSRSLPSSSFLFSNP